MVRPCPGHPTCLPTVPVSRGLHGAGLGWVPRGTGYQGVCSGRVGRARPGTRFGHHRCSLMPAQPLGTPGAMGFSEGAEPPGLACQAASNLPAVWMVVGVLLIS